MGRATRERETGRREGVRVAGKRENRRWHHYFASVATFCRQTPIQTCVHLVVRVRGGGFRTAESIAFLCCLPLPCSQVVRVMFYVFPVCFSTFVMCCETLKYL